LFFEIRDMKLKAGKLHSRFFQSVSILFDIQIGGLTVVVPDLRIGRDMFSELFL